jgi:hypothetical protein
MADTEVDDFIIMRLNSIDILLPLPFNLLTLRVFINIFFFFCISTIPFYYTRFIAHKYFQILFYVSENECPPVDRVIRWQLTKCTREYSVSCFFSLTYYKYNIYARINTKALLFVELF